MTLFVAEGIGPDGAVTGYEIDAPDRAEAEKLCALMGWELKGTLEELVDPKTGTVLFDRAAADEMVANFLKRASNVEG